MSIKNKNMVMNSALGDKGMVMQTVLSPSSKSKWNRREQNQIVKGDFDSMHEPGGTTTYCVDGSTGLCYQDIEFSVLHISLRFIPHARLFGSVPDLKRFVTFGCAAYVRKLPEQVKGTFSAKANCGIFMGYLETQKGVVNYLYSLFV